MNRALSAAVTIAYSFALSACGSGGGGGDTPFVGAANVDVRATPNEIDSGDRALISTEVSEVHENGIALKFRFPESLAYVPSSAMLLINNREVDLTPTVNKLSDDEGMVYVVFYLTQNQFTRSGQKYNGESGTVQLQVEGIDALEDGKVEVDADVDDPLEKNTTEFSIENPEFVSEAEASIRVKTE